jgi:hypothetical protein
MHLKKFFAPKPDNDQTSENDTQDNLEFQNDMPISRPITKALKK